MTGKDEIALYDATRVLITELNTSGFDFSEAVHKYAVSHIVPGSKTQVSFKSLLDEFEEALHLDKGKSEIVYRENCIKKMLDKIAQKILLKEIDLKELNLEEFSYKEMNEFLKVSLDIFNQEPPVFLDEQNRQLKKKLRVLADTKKSNDGEGDEEEDGEKEWKPHQITQKEQAIFKDTMEYIMNEKDYISIEEFTELMQIYLSKQKHSMEVLYRLKQFIKRKH